MYVAKMMMQGDVETMMHAPPQSNSNGDLLLNSPVELQSQPESVPQPMWSINFSQRQTTLLHFAVIMEQQFQLQAGNVTSVGSPLAMKQQVQPVSNHAALFQLSSYRGAPTSYMKGELKNATSCSQFFNTAATSIKFILFLKLRFSIMEL